MISDLKWIEVFLSSYLPCPRKISHRVIKFCTVPVNGITNMVHPEEKSIGSDNFDFSKVSDFNGGL